MSTRRSGATIPAGAGPVRSSRSATAPSRRWLQRRRPKLADEAIRLEPAVEGFVADFAALAEDPDVIRFTRVPASRDDGFAAAWVGRYTDGWEMGSRAGFAVVDVASGEFLGMAGLVAIDWDASEGEIGYIVAPGARGRGVAGRAIALIADWALGELGLARLEAWIDVANKPSMRAAERAGFTFEGVRRSVSFKEGLRADMAIYSLLRAEAGLLARDEGPARPGEHAEPKPAAGQ